MANEPQPQQPQNFFIQPTAHPLEPSVAHAVLKPDDVLDFIEHTLRGDTYDPTKYVWVENKDMAMMNEKGIRFTMLNLRAMHSRITTLGIKNEQQLYDELYTFLAYYAIWLRVRAREINFRTAYYHTFISMLATTLSSTYSRALMGAEQDFIHGLHPESMKQQQQGQQGGGLLGSLFR